MNWFDEGSVLGVLCTIRMPLDVCWLKKDARLADHGPLSEVLLRENNIAQFVVLYLYEPSQLRLPTVHGSFVNFANEGVAEVEVGLRRLRGGGGDGDGDKDGEQVLTVQVAEAVDALDGLHRSHHGPIVRLLSHQETGNEASYRRDLQVKAWCCVHNVPWKEFQQAGVVRGLRSRADIETKPFSSRWTEFMKLPQHPDPRATPASRRAASRALVQRLVVGTASVGMLLHSADPRLGLQFPDDRPARQRPGGETPGMQLLNSFLAQRGRGYSAGISSPTSAWTSCSRLSAFLTHGNTSVRMVFQKLADKQTQLREMQRVGDQDAKGWLKPLADFAGRLRWRSHFIQVRRPDR